MAKNYKIKRYNRIYRGKRSTGSLVLRGALVAAAVFIVAFVGYNAYGPIRDYFSARSRPLHTTRRARPSPRPRPPKRPSRSPNRSRPSPPTCARST